MNASIQIAIAAFLLFIGVATGAFGAHALTGLVDINLMAVWHTAVLYLFVHGLGMLGLAASQHLLQSRLQTLAYNLLFVGTLLFSGSLFLLVLSGQSWLGMITPIGGMLMLAGWLTTLAAAIRFYKTTTHTLKK
ncbi:DUF423 domain-containing protein [Paenalcaligenes faecalis]|uniref:DUF423 domain-containing protein n=1 Tax=Paenalcaligenes faecalis TaxID=2980099 RepID=UPI0022B98D37|nr:DUF423 domain-containing protein [Paenalcaligenes faecalis]